MIKKLSAVILGAVLMVSLSGCGGKTGSGSGKVTLRVATWREFDKEYYEEIERKFEEKYDYIDVVLEFNVNENSYNTNIQADLVAGTIADVFDMHHSGTMQMYGEYGFIVDQTDMDYMNNYDDVAKKINSWNGKSYAYMNNYNYFGFMYNIDAFKDAGVKIPSTPEELVTAVGKLKAAGYGGIAYPGSQVGTTFLNGCLFISMGTNEYDNLMTGMDDGSITDLTNISGLDDGLKTVEYYANADIFYVASESISYEPALSLFATGKSAILWGGTYFFGEKEIYFPDINAGYFPMPTYAGNGISYAEPGQNSCISAKSEHIEEAKLWIEFIASPEISEYYCTNAKMFSPIKGVIPKFEEAEMIRDSSAGYNLVKFSYYNNGEWWNTEWEQLQKGVFWNGDSYKEHLELVSAQLKKADIKGLKK